MKKNNNNFTILIILLILGSIIFEIYFFQSHQFYLNQIQKSITYLLIWLFYIFLFRNNIFEYKSFLLGTTPFIVYPLIITKIQNESTHGFIVASANIIYLAAVVINIISLYKIKKLRKNLNKILSGSQILLLIVPWLFFLLNFVPATDLKFNIFVLSNIIILNLWVFVLMMANYYSKKPELIIFSIFFMGISMLVGIYRFYLDQFPFSLEVIRLSHVLSMIFLAFGFSNLNKR